MQVKYLGTCPVTSDSGEEVTANAIKAILATAKRLEKKLARVEVTVSLAGVTVREQEALQCLFDLPIDSISYCSADPTYDRVFAVLCTEGEGTACHAFHTQEEDGPGCHPHHRPSVQPCLRDVEERETSHQTGRGNHQRANCKIGCCYRGGGGAKALDSIHSWHFTIHSWNFTILSHRRPSLLLSYKRGPILLLTGPTSELLGLPLSQPTPA